VKSDAFLIAMVAILTGIVVAFTIGAIADLKKRIKDLEKRK
jgi:hypothetical protein